LCASNADSSPSQWGCELFEPVVAQRPHIVIQKNQIISTSHTRTKVIHLGKVEEPAESYTSTLELLGYDAKSCNGCFVTYLVLHHRECKSGGSGRAHLS